MNRFSNLGCIGINPTVQLRGSGKHNKYEALLAKTGVVSIGGYYVQPLDKKVIQEFNDREANLSITVAQGTDLRRIEEVAFLMNRDKDRMCAIVDSIEQIKVGREHHIYGEIHLVGREGKVVKELIDSGIGQLMFGTRCEAVVEHVTREIAVTKLLAFDVVFNLGDPPKPKTGYTKRVVQSFEEFA